MKKCFYMFAILLMSGLSLYAQNKEDKDETSQKLVFKKEEVGGDYYYEEVVQTAGKTQAELYAKAKNWIIANFKTADNNINFDEKEFSIVNAAAVKLDKKKTMGWAVYDGTIDFKFRLWTKDGKYRLRIDNITYHMLYASFPDGMKTKTESYGELEGGKLDRYLKSQAEGKLFSVVAVFKNGMVADGTPEKKDW